MPFKTKRFPNKCRGVLNRASPFEHNKTKMKKKFQPDTSKREASNARRTSIKDDDDDPTTKIQ